MKKGEIAMYAIVNFKGFQYKVEENKVLKVSYIEGLEEGSELEMSDVIFISDNGEVKVGNPVVENAKVMAEVVGSGRDKKVIVFKKKKRKGYSKKQGHRQYFTQIKIKEILQ